MTSYHDKLLDPRWQRRRLETLLRDDFTCQKCFDNKKTVHVHHKIYYKDRDPWDYKDEELITECEDCHPPEAPNFYNIREKMMFEEIAAGIVSQPYTKKLSLELDRLIEKYHA